MSEAVVRYTETAVDIEARLSSAVVDGVIVLPVGPAGKDGPVGPSATGIEVQTAGTVISALRVLRFDAGKVFYLDSQTLSHMHSCVGISVTSAPIDTAVDVRFSSFMTDSSWSWTPQAPIYCGANGVLTQIAPTSPSTFSLRVGTAVTPTKIFVQIERPIKLA